MHLVYEEGIETEILLVAAGVFLRGLGVERDQWFGSFAQRITRIFVQAGTRRRPEWPLPSRPGAYP